MEIDQSHKSLVKFLIPLITAHLGAKGIFYLFSFEYLLFLDAFDIQKFLIDISVFGGLFYIALIGVNHFTSPQK